MNIDAKARKAHITVREREWEQWMAGLEERLKRRREERAGVGGSGREEEEEGGGGL